MNAPTRTSSSANQQIARATGTVMAAFVICNLVGLVRGMVITRAFGTSLEFDSFNAANRIVELLFNLVAGGALGSAFIPMFTGFLAKEDREGAWRLASGVINLVFLILVIISVLAWIFAPQMMSDGLFLLVPESDPVQEALTVQLLPYYAALGDPVWHQRAGNEHPERPPELPDPRWRRHCIPWG